MFPILTTDSLLQTLGLGTLSDAISCEVEEERNGIYELTLEYPQGGAHASDLALNALIVAKPNFTDAPQPFRIYAIKKEISGKIEVHAQHISYDLGGVIVAPTTMTGATCKQAGDYLVTGTNFTFKTDKTNSADFKVDVPSSARSWLGGKSGSLLSVYGTGEYHYDGYEIEFNLHRGMNRGVQLRYGKNLTELESEADCSNLASSVVCYYEDNGSVTMGTPVSTGLTGITRELAVDVSDDYNSPPSVATLTARASTYIADHNLTVPKTNITLDFVQASKLKDRVDLCDTVSIYYDALDVSATAKCIRTVWDVLAERYTETEFGDAKTDFSDTIIEVERVASEAVTKTTMEQAIDSATEQITGNNGGYVVLHDSNGDQEPDEILVMDSPDISTATKLWRFNSSGLGYSSTGYSGPYGIAITQNGEIVCDFLTAGTLNANVIRAGILEDAAGKNSWNLQTGAFTITEGSINITTTSTTADQIVLRYDRWTSSMRAGSFFVNNTSDGWSSILQGGALYMTHESVNPNTHPLEISFGVLRYRNENTNTLQQLIYSNQIEQNDYSGNLRQKIGFDSVNNYGKISQYDSSGTARTEVNGNGEISLHASDGTLRTKITDDGLWMYDADGDSRFEIDRTGEAVVRIKNGSGVTRAQLQNTATVLFDGSSNELARYAYNGATFKNSSGTTTAAYPNNPTNGLGDAGGTGISAYSTRSSVQYGGAWVIGNTVFVNVVFTSSHSATNSPRMLTSSFKPMYDTALTCTDITNGANNIGDPVGCGINYNGAIYTKTSTSGHAYAVTGVFPLA